LRALESHDIIGQWFYLLHDKQLNSKRAFEINAAAKHAREYFVNASSASYIVRPLYTFYGVTCLSRALSLLLNRNVGEEGLTKGHGLETNNWHKHLDGELKSATRNVGKISVKVCSGLFLEFANLTENLMPLHIYSEAIDWQISYPKVVVDCPISLDEILQRMPDLRDEQNAAKSEAKYANISELKSSNEGGIFMNIARPSLGFSTSVYEELGYRFELKNGIQTLQITADQFHIARPLYVHSYLKKTFGTIPDLHLAEPFEGANQYSQLLWTYILSYILGMLVRYYPTHWTALADSRKGDLYWPRLIQCQEYTQLVFPELILEFTKRIIPK